MDQSNVNEYIELEVTFKRVAFLDIDDSEYIPGIFPLRPRKCLVSTSTMSKEMFDDNLRDQPEEIQREFLALLIESTMKNIKNDLLYIISSKDLKSGILEMIGTPEELENIEMET